MCICCYAGKVYNVTHFLKYHPGRKAQLLRGAGTDCTALFDKVQLYCMWMCNVPVMSCCRKV